MLATTKQLAELLRQPHDPTNLQLLRALEDSSALFRALARQTISEVEADEVELEGNWTRRLWLPERPVTAVSALSIVTDDAVEALATTSYHVSRRGLVKLSWGSYWGGDDATIHVTYSHGYAEVPEDVQAVVLAIAARQVTNPEGAASEGVSLAGASTTYRPPGLSMQEERVISRYKPMLRT
jgi:hypothetical protein